MSLVLARLRLCYRKHNCQMGEHARVKTTHWHFWDNLSKRSNTKHFPLFVNFGTQGSCALRTHSCVCHWLPLHLTRNGCTCERFMYCSIRSGYNLTIDIAPSIKHRHVCAPCSGMCRNVSNACTLRWSYFAVCSRYKLLICICVTTASTSNTHIRNGHGCGWSCRLPPTTHYAATQHDMHHLKWPLDHRRPSQTGWSSM